MTNYCPEENTVTIVATFKMKMQQITEKNCRRVVLRHLWS